MTHNVFTHTVLTTFITNILYRARFEEVFAVALAQIKQSGWFTYSQVKMLVALSLSANHSELAADFVR